MNDAIAFDNTRNNDSINNEINVKTECEDIHEHEVKTEMGHVKDWKNEINDEVTDDTYNDRTYIEEIYIKSEPVDTSRFELESEDVTNTESCSIQQAYYVSSTDDISQYNYDTNIIITEEIDIKPECGDDGEYVESAAGHDAANQPSTSKGVAKNPSGKIVKTGQRLMAYNLYLNNKKKGLSKTQAVIQSAAKVGIGQGLLWKVVAEMESTGKIETPSKKRSREDFFSKLREDDKKAVRQAVHAFFKRNEMPTLDKVLHALEENDSIPRMSRSTLFRVLKNLGFVWEKRARGMLPGNPEESPDQSTDSFNKFNQQRTTSNKYDICMTSLKPASSLTDHEGVYSGQKPFTCDQCGREFSKSSRLTRHKLIHSGEKPFKCDQCNKAFSQSAHLVTHKRIHSGEKPYKCDHCNKAFSKSSNLISHKRTHSGEKLFKCDQCDKSFSLLAHLINHKRIHSGEKPFKCGHCDAAFSVSSNLKRHKQIHS